MANIRRSSNTLIKPYPPSNSDCHCKEIHTSEGTYLLIREIYQDGTPPQFSSGTHVSFFGPSVQQQQQQQQQYLSLPKCSMTSISSDGTSENDSSMIEEEDTSSSSHSTENIPLPTIVLSRSASDQNRGLVPPTILQPSVSDSHLMTVSNHIPQGEEEEGSSLSSLFGHHRRSHSFTNHHRKPKTSLSKLKSTFIEYITTGDHFTTRSDFGVNIFYNIGVNFFWNDLTNELTKTPLSKLTFAKAYPTCHDVNAITSSKDHLDVIIGFNTGDLVWYDTVCNRYTRINKNGAMNGSSVTMVKWVPGSEDLIMASFDDGSILVLDKERDDQPFFIPEPQSWAEEHFQVTKPHSKHSKHNPVAHWRVSQKGITAFAFSPNLQYVATVGKDGLMRTIDYTNERLCDVFASYYGSLLCVAWSPDNKYILTGGQDDLVTIWSFRESKIIARCQGHRSWVTGVAFDPLHCDEKEYRFASVGEDCKLLLWDFSVNALHKPKQKWRRSSTTSISIPMPMNESPLVNSNDKDVSSSSGLGKRFRKRSLLFGTATSLPDSLIQPNTVGQATQHVRLPTIHPAASKCQVPFLQPIVKQIIHPDPCVDVIFRDQSIVTTDRRGRLRVWGRPATTIVK
ncbi:unnamed protein product [Mucor hiemalis]